MKKVIAIIILAIATFSILFWYRKTTQYKPLESTIIVGTSADFPPFSFRDQNNTIVGFDIDVVKEVAKRLNLQTNIQDKPFSMLLPQIQLGQIHVIAAGMTPTPERSKNVNFTKPYLINNPLLIVTMAQNPKVTSLQDLKGKKVIVNTGYTAETYMSKIPDIALVRLPKVTDAITALEQGKGYAFVTADFTLRPFIKAQAKNKDCFNIFKLVETDEENALAISKKLPKDFLTQVQKSLDDMQADGTLEALKQKWEVI